jgi:hypothetical protein
MRVAKMSNLIKIIWATFLFVLPIAGVTHDNEDETIEREISEIIQIAIDAPNLQQYYHVLELPDRVPLVIKLPDTLSSVSLSRVNKFGHPVKLYAPEMTSPFFEVLNWKVSSSGIIFEAAYKIEGLGMIYEFEKREGDWHIGQMDLWEN